jgi:hypothetical protein
MIVSKTDIAAQATLTLTPTSDIQDPIVITNGDYSAVYTDALDTSLKIQFDFASPQKIGYIALSGNFSSKDRIVIKSVDTTQEVYLFSSDGFALYSSDGFRLLARYENSIDDSNLGLNESRVMMYQVDIADSSQIEIEVFGTGQITISQIAMGEYYEVPRGEQGGYRYPWTIPNIQGRTATSLNKSPIALAYEATTIETSISIPNNIKADFPEYKEFVDFAISNTFYVLDDADKFHSYAGFNFRPAQSTAHPLTRQLLSSTYTYNAYSVASGLFI